MINWCHFTSFSCRREILKENLWAKSFKVNKNLRQTLLSKWNMTAIQTKFSIRSFHYTIKVSLEKQLLKRLGKLTEVMFNVSHISASVWVTLKHKIYHFDSRWNRINYCFLWLRGKLTHFRKKDCTTLIKNIDQREEIFITKILIFTFSIFC